MDVISIVTRGAALVAMASCVGWMQTCRLHKMSLQANSQQSLIMTLIRRKMQKTCYYYETPAPFREMRGDGRVQRLKNLSAISPLRNGGGEGGGDTKL